MNRITSKTDGVYTAPPGAVAIEAERATGEAIERLGMFEDAVELIEQQLARATAKLDDLKARGKIRSALGQQLLAQKLTYSSTLTLLGVKDAD